MPYGWNIAGHDAKGRLPYDLFCRRLFTSSAHVMALQGSRSKPYDAADKSSWSHQAMVLRLFPPCALVSRAQGSSGVVDNMLFAWRGHTKRLTTRAGPRPDLAVWLG